MELLQTLNIDPRILLFNIVLFLVLLHVLDRMYWRPVTKKLEERRQSISDAYRTVEEARQEMESLRVEYEGRLARIEADARARIQQTVKEAQAQREQLLADARRQAEEIVAAGMHSIREESERTSREMREMLDDAALEVYSRVVGSTPGPRQRALVDEYIAREVVGA